MKTLELMPTLRYPSSADTKGVSAIQSTRVACGHVRTDEDGCEDVVPAKGRLPLVEEPGRDREEEADEQHVWYKLWAAKILLVFRVQKHTCDRRRTAYWVPEAYIGLPSAPHEIASLLYDWTCWPDQILVPWTSRRISR